MGESSARGKMSEHLKSVKAANDQEVCENQQLITKAKGRAQITATTAMSIVNVALLKGVVDLGPENNRYYIGSLVLICVSLGLQVTAGIMSIMIENILSYMNRYNHNMCEDASTNCCPMMCVSRKTLTNHKPTDDIEMQSINDAEYTMESDHKVAITYYNDVTNVNRNCCACCPLVCRIGVYVPYEIDILEKHEECKKKFLSSELNTLEIEGKAKHLDAKISQLKNNLKNLEEQQFCSKGKADARVEEIQNLKSSIQTMEAERLKLEGDLMKAEIKREQGEIILEYSESVRKSRIMRLATHWQQILNYMFYVIFVLNAIITGFGLGSGHNAEISTATSANQ